MHGKKRTSPIIYYAAIDPAGGGGGGQPGGTPSGAPTPNAQPGSQGGGQGGGFREQFFPNVPDEVWGQVEPHVRNVQGHVTQLEQRYAPFKSYRDEDLQGLANFSTAFDRDPVGQWLRIAQVLQQNGQLDEELDLEHLAAIVTGTMPDEQPATQQPSQNGDVPPWAQQLMQRLDKLEGGVNQFTSSHRQQVEDAVLQRQLTTMKDGLKKAGFPDDAVSQEQLLAAYIAHRGNAQAALQSFVGMRTNLLKGFTRQGRPGTQPAPNQASGDNNDLELTNGVPPVRQPRRGSGPRNSVVDSKTKAAAEQYLRTQGSE